MFTILSPRQKAQQVNQDKGIYGTFAEIGAGQEVARYFFQAGGASGTIAKTISAYDMKFSDAIYGQESTGRYVCEKRLKKMLDHESKLLVERLSGTEREDTRFFVFADTVATHRVEKWSSAHGWMGFRFQHQKGAPWSEVILHIKMHDIEVLQQQESLGILGTNLVHAPFFHHQSPETFIEALYHHLNTSRIEIDYIDVQGPAFEVGEGQLFNLLLVRSGRAQAVLFGKDGSVLLPVEEFYKKNIVVIRGSYRPPTLVNVDMIEKGVASFKKEFGSSDAEILVLTEISVASVDMDRRDFLHRVELLRSLGHHVLITKFAQYYKLTDYFARYTQKSIGIVLGAYNFKQIFDESYSDEDGGILGALGQIFQHRVHLFIYPYKEEKEKELITLQNLPIQKKFQTLFLHLLESGQISDVEKAKLENLHIFSRKIYDMIRKGQSNWQQFVPENRRQRNRRKVLI